jgi:hypothetical protein
MNNELVIQKKGSDLIYYCSYFQLIVCFFSLYYKIYKCSAITIITFYTSTNYWRNPIQNSNRRIVDILCVISGIAYHGYIIKDYEFSNKYFKLIGIGSLLYPLGFCFNKQYIYIPAINHCLLQLLADIIAINIYKNLYLENTLKNM